MQTTRNITTTECHWLLQDIPAGTPVFNYDGPTYGTTTPGVQVYSLVGEDVFPFFELPADAVSND